MPAFFAPMADSHVHANGMIDDKTVLALADKYEVKLGTPQSTPYITATGRRVWPDYKYFHEAYDACVSLIRSPEDIYSVAKSYLTGIGSQGAIYADIFSSSMNNVRGGDAWPVFRDNTIATLQAMEDAETETGIETALAITFKRHLSNGVDAAHKLVTLTRQFKDAGLDINNRVNSFHMAGNELAASCLQYAPIYVRAMEELEFNRNGLHAGEIAGPSDVWDAIKMPNITRIGHALGAAKDKALMDRMRDDGFVVEIVLTSNRDLHGYTPSSHPIDILLANGIALSLGSDDPGLFRSTIVDEYRKARDDFGFNNGQLLNFTVNAVKHGFAPTWRRQEVLDRLKAFNSEYDIGLADANFALSKTGGTGTIVLSAPHPNDRIRVLNSSYAT